MRHNIRLMLPERLQELIAAHPAPVHGSVLSDDEHVDTFYSCTICQSYVPFHACIIKPEKQGVCGNYGWHDARLLCSHWPGGPFKVVNKKECLHRERGEWAGVNEAVRESSGGRITRWSAYSIVHCPETACRCSECMAAIIPEARGVMVAHHGYQGLTPSGFTFEELIDTAARGSQVPGFMGFDESFLLSRRFLAAEGGFLRLVWMPQVLKERVARACVPGSGREALLTHLNCVANEHDALTLNELIPWLEEARHPALSMTPLL
jgi:CO dehydrogenase/acetyl-CoA synthase beta subunit